MGVHIIEDTLSGYKVLYCSTTMKPFGDVYYQDDNLEEFLEWLGVDPRKITDSELSTKYYQWRDKNDTDRSKEKCKHPIEKRASFKSNSKPFCWQCGKHVDPPESQATKTA